MAFEEYLVYFFPICSSPFCFFMYLLAQKLDASANEVNLWPELTAPSGGSGDKKGKGHNYSGAQQKQTDQGLYKLQNHQPLKPIPGLAMQIIKCDINTHKSGLSLARTIIHMPIKISSFPIFSGLSHIMAVRASVTSETTRGNRPQAAEKRNDQIIRSTAFNCHLMQEQGARQPLVTVLCPG